MKKIILVIVILLFIIVLIPDDTSNKEMRIRVIGSSDTSYDQLVKQRVVIIVQSVISANDDINTVIKKEKILNSKIKTYLDSINETFTLEIKNSNFPMKELNGVIIPGGIYKTLLIKIGKANGSNWWSLLYPEYFNVTFEDIKSGNVKYEFYFYEKFKKIFNK